MVGLMIWNFNASLILSGVCQLIFRQYLLDDDAVGDDDNVVDIERENRRGGGGRGGMRRGRIGNRRQRQGDASNNSNTDSAMDEMGVALFDTERRRQIPLEDRTLTEERLAQTYAVIYGPITDRYLEGEEARTWMWLIGALLINVVCIRIELILFQSLVTNEAGMTGNNSTITDDYAIAISNYTNL